MRVLNICATLLLLACCSSPPVSPLQDVTVEQVKLVKVHAAGGASGEMSGRENLEPFLQGLTDLEPFRIGKVVSQLDVTVVMSDGSSVDLRMGPDHIGPNVAASAVVWRWKLPDDSSYRLAEAALQAGSR